MLKGRKLFWLKAVTALAVLALCLSPAVTAFSVYADGPDSRDVGTTVATEQPSYKPGETINITGKGYAANAPVTVMLTKPDGTVVRWTVNADDSGNIATEYALENSTEGAYFVQLSDGTNSAYTIFTDPSNPTYLFPTNDVHTELSEHGTGSQHSNQIDDGAGTVWPNTPAHDGDTTYVYTSSKNWKRDIYQFENLPGNYDLGGSGDDNTPPDTPAPYSTSHAVNVWSNNPTVVMVWKPVNDAPGSGGTGATVTITAVAREHDGQGYMQFVVVPPARPHDIEIYTPSQGSELDGNWLVYTYTMATDPDGNPWAINSINSLEAGLQLKANCQARVTQMYLLITPGSGESSSGLKGYNWYWDNPPTSFTTGTTVTQTLSDGSHDFYVNAEDNAGNTSPFGTSGPYLIDTQDPNLTKDLSGTPGNNGWYVSPVLVALHATDDLSGVDYIMYSTDGGNTWTTVTNTTSSGVGNGKSGAFDTNFTLTQDGIITLAHKTQDVAGNEYELAAQTVKIDQTPPGLTKNLYTWKKGNWVLTNNPNGQNGWYVSDVQIRLTAYDATSGVAEIQFQVDGGGWQTYSAPFTLTEDGVIHLQHQAFDVAGNVYVLPEQDIKIDQTPPTLSKELDGTLGNEGWYTSPVNVQLNAHDDTSGVASIQYKTGLFGWWNTASAPIVNGQGPEDFSTGFTLSQEGRTTLYHRAYDAAGNKGTEPAGASQVIKIDYTEPQLYKIECGEEGDNGWYISPVYVRLTAVDPNPLQQSGINYIQYQINGGPVNKDYGPRLWLLGLPDQGLPVWATDFIVSTEGVVPLNHEAFDVAGNDSDYSGPAYYVPLLGYRVGDSQQLKIDLTDPELVKDLSGTKGKNGWYISPVLVTLTATDAMPGSGIYEIRYSVDGTPHVVYSGAEGIPSLQTDFTLTDDGIHNLTHQTRDYAGRTFVLLPQKVKIDQTPPTLTKDLNGTQGNNGWYVSPVLVTLTATDATSGVYEIKYGVNGEETTVPGGPEGTNTAEAKFTLADDGAYALTHETSDYAGHTTVLPAQEVRIDQTPPSLAKSAARTGATQVTVTLVGTDATSGVDYIRYSVDGGETWAQAPVVNGYGPNTFQATFTVEGVGEHNLSHLVFDVAGNYYVLGDQILTIEGTTPAGMMLFVPRLVITLDILGTTAEYPVTAEGMLITDARVTSPDGSVTLEIPAGTLVLNADGSPTYLNEDYDIVFKAAGTPPAPAGYQVIAAYEALPSGLTFSKDIRLILTYDENKLPQGSSAVIAYYDEAKKQWTPLETAGYVAAGGIEMPNTVVSRVGHFTYFAVLAKLPAGK